jgi:hypothetical protein
MYCLNLLRLGDIQEMGLTIALFLEGLKGWPIDIGRIDLGSFTGKGNGTCAPDALSGRGDEGFLARQTI